MRKHAWHVVDAFSSACNDSDYVLKRIFKYKYSLIT